jgi:hypothetical protein
VAIVFDDGVDTARVGRTVAAAADTVATGLR